MKKINIFHELFSSQIIIEIEDEIEEIMLFNAFGKFIQREKKSNFSVSDLTKGVYLINIKTNGGLFQTRFLKQ